MNRLTLIFIGLLCMLGCNVNPDRKPKYGNFENAWERDNLFGKVKLLEQFKANVIDFESGESEKPLLTLKKIYTNFGEISFQEHCDGFGKALQYIKNEYNGKHQRIKSVSENYSMPSKSEETDEFDHDGNLVLANVIFNDSIHFKASLEYDSLGHLIAQTNIQDNDTARVRFEYKFNCNGKTLMKKKIEKGKYGNHEFINEFKYDQNGNIIEIINKFGYSGKTKLIYEYNGHDRIKKTTQYQSAQIEKETSFDKYYNPLLIKFYASATLNKELSYEYDFDKQGNWIERKVFMKEYSGKDKKILPIFTETRKIEYFE